MKRYEALTEAELHQAISDALEDAGLYNPSSGLVDDVYEGLVAPLVYQLKGAVRALADLLDALDDAPSIPNDPTWAAIVQARGALRQLHGGQSAASDEQEATP